MYAKGACTTLRVLGERRRKGKGIEWDADRMIYTLGTREISIVDRVFGMRATQSGWATTVVEELESSVDIAGNGCRVAMSGFYSGLGRK